MTKQEEIQQAWGDYFEDLKYYLDDDGWFNKNHFRFFSIKYDEISRNIDFIHDIESNCMRPKILSKYVTDTIRERINYWLNILSERKESASKEIQLHKNNPEALIIHEQIEFMRANDGIDLLNKILENGNS